MTTGEKIAAEIKREFAWVNAPKDDIQRIAKLIDYELKADRETNAQRAAEQIQSRMIKGNYTPSVAFIRDIILNP